MILGGWRLVRVDLQQEVKTALFLSLLVYDAALMFIPRLMRTRTMATTSES
jgi:hypothetical protein